MTVLKRETYEKGPPPMKVILRRDIVIPAGTVFETAPDKTVRNNAEGDHHYLARLALEENGSCGSIEYCIESDDDIAWKWFSKL